MLSEEEKKLLKIFKAQVEKEEQEYFSVNAYTQLLYDSHRTVLNLITKLEKENEEKDKKIDLMIEEYEYNARINFKNFCEDELRKDNCIQDCKTCAKKYFEKLAKEKGE